MVRHPWEAAPSLARVENIDLAKAHLLWLAHVRDALHACQDQGYVLVTFDQLLADPVSTLVRMGTELNMAWPNDPWSFSSSLLDFIQPRLKRHHASNLPDKDKQKFHAYERLYKEIRRGQWAGMAEGNAVEPRQLQNPNATLQTAKGIMPAQSSTTETTDWPDLVESLLDVIGQYEKQAASRLTEQKRIAAEPGHSLFAQVVFPSTRKRGEIVETIPLIADEWQHITLPVPEPILLRDKPIILKPLNTNGTVMISVLKLVKLTIGEVLWAAQTPQDFEALKLSGTVLRMPDLDNFILLATGDELCVCLPLMGKLPDCPVGFEVWMRACRGQQIIHRSIGYRQPRQKRSSNLVWLASYPRSGNTLLRIILNHNFGLKSYSIYNDNSDIGKIFEVSEVVGHQFMHWPLFLGKQHASKLQPKEFEQLDPLRYKTQNLKLVKTHSPYHEGFAKDKVIYIYRDGRAALRSFASYKDKFNQNNRSLSELLDTLLCCGDNMFGLWSEHALSWMQHPKDKILFLKFEDVVSDFNTTFKKIAAFLEIDPVRTDVLSFQQLQAINADFFRKGQKKSWQDLFDDARNALFWILNHETMSALGYDNDQHLICETLKTSGQKVARNSQKRGYSVECLMEFDQILQECAGIFSKNIDKVLNSKRLLIGKQLRKAYLQFLDFFKTHASQGSVYGWTNKWDALLNNKIFLYTVSQKKIIWGLRNGDEITSPSRRIDLG
ncbi:MAG: hypothetical protein HF982_09825 [Desulfobacteraceae bacterium]|nr:hypothetical protein [Desulfobacteraceae bacterium]MBC2719864.1 sulfotransferase domain-containing protein [Desulfobacteraceae bacterium]